ncbi:MAG: DUF3570 domain-containing protein [Aequorivita sp.]|nr:DUF3570 domain-containing protein [Aequorivita sp.]
MKKLIYLPILLFAALGIAQENQAAFKKRVLETTEVDFLTSYYTQDGNNASVTGGIGTEKLSDFTPTIVISMPLNADDVLTIDAGISAYTSASSSNLNPFDISGASRNGGGDDDDEDDDRNAAGNVIGSPWVASSGASRQDVWSNVNLDYSHSSDNRNTVWNADVSLATEYDYFSLGFGGGILKQFNEKNTTLGVNTKIYLDTWMPKYPTELDSYLEVNGNLNQGFFEGITILDQNGNASTGWNPISGFKLIDNKGRNSYSLSFSFSQILNKNAQVSLFFDVVQQKGWLSNPMQRVYFADVANYFIGNASSINNYTSPNNKDVFQLADDIERLPDTRFKMPFGLRFNYYFNEVVTMRTYYRYYFDDWGITSHTASVEVPIKITDKFTLYPSYRFYNQTAADYFYPYETALSSYGFYTSDYDLSEFSANQYGFGVSYTDIFTKLKLANFGLKSVDLKYDYYKRDTGLHYSLISAGFKFIGN